MLSTGRESHSNCLSSDLRKLCVDVETELRSATVEAEETAAAPRLRRMQLKPLHGPLSSRVRMVKSRNFDMRFRMARTEDLKEEAEELQVWFSRQVSLQIRLLWRCVADFFFSNAFDTRISDLSRQLFTLVYLLF